MDLVLASGSPRRRILLGLLVDAFRIDVPGVDETLTVGPLEKALEQVAARKAEAVAHTLAGSVAGAAVLAADTVVLDDGRVAGKPADRAEAAASLRTLVSTGHDVLTALALRCGSRTTTTHVRSRVRAPGLPANIMASYLEGDGWRDKAGGYGVQDALLTPYIRVDGPWSNVVGLPLDATRLLLEAAGIPCRRPPDEETLMRQNPF